MTGFYMTCNTGLKWVNACYPLPLKQFFKYYRSIIVFKKWDCPFISKTYATIELSLRHFRKSLATHIFNYIRIYNPLKYLDGIFSENV